MYVHTKLVQFNINSPNGWWLFNQTRFAYNQGNVKCGKQSLFFLERHHTQPIHSILNHNNPFNSINFMHCS